MGKPANNTGNSATSNPNPNPNPKKRKASGAAEAVDEAIMAPAAKKPKIQSLSRSYVSGELYIYLTLYSQKKNSLDDFKKEMDALLAKTTSEYSLLSLIFPAGRVKYTTALREAFKQDEFFEWILDEIEQCIEKESINLISFVVNIMSYISSEARLSTLLSKPRIKELVFNHGVRALMTQIVGHRDMKTTPLDLIKQHFSAEQVEQLKSKALRTCKTGEKLLGETLLDVLLCLDLESVIDFWEAGFRPYSQEYFNINFFSVEPADILGNQVKHDFKIANRIYRKIVNSDEYSELLVLPEESNQVGLFLENGAIDKETFAQLLEKKKLVPNLQILMAFIREMIPGRFSRAESIQIVEKILYILSSFELSLNQPAPPSFLNNLGELIALSIVY